MAGAEGGISRLELHLIGPLQSNKMEEAVALFDAIHSLDRSEPRARHRRRKRQDRKAARNFRPDQYRRGTAKGGRGARCAALIADCRARLGLKVVGLMCIPPVETAPAPHFALLAKIAREEGLSLLSMGMSDDFEIAINFGATHVRVGTAIFGERPPFRRARRGLDRRQTCSRIPLLMQALYLSSASIISGTTYRRRIASPGHWIALVTRV